MKSWWWFSTGHKEQSNVVEGLWVSGHEGESCLFWPQTRRERQAFPGQILLGYVAIFYVLFERLHALVRWPGESFFICQTHIDEDIVDCLNRAIETNPLTNFLESQIGLLTE